MSTESPEPVQPVDPYPVEQPPAEQPPVEPDKGDEPETPPVE